MERWGRMRRYCRQMPWAFPIFVAARVASAACSRAATVFALQWSKECVGHESRINRYFGDRKPPPSTQIDFQVLSTDSSKRKKTHALVPTCPNAKKRKKTAKNIIDIQVNRKCCRDIVRFTPIDDALDVKENQSRKNADCEYRNND